VTDEVVLVEALHDHDERLWRNHQGVAQRSGPLIDAFGQHLNMRRWR
jgi:hypothetical protein